MLISHFVKTMFRPVAKVRRKMLDRQWLEVSSNPKLAYENLEIFIREQYRYVFGKYPNLKKPVTFNEKMQWLKLNWHHGEAMKCADKYEARDFIKQRIGERYLNELYGVWDDPRDIKLRDLPD